MEVKGTAVVAIRDFVKNNYPKDFEKWISTLSSDSKTIFTDSIDATKWYPIEAGAKEPTEKISQVFFAGNMEKGAVEAGKYSAEKALTGIYKIFVKAANPQYIIKRATRVFGTYYRPCEIHVVNEPHNGVVIELSKVEPRYEVIEKRIIGWCERALEISGCKNVVISEKLVREELNGKVVEINMSWN